MSSDFDHFNKYNTPMQYLHRILKYSIYKVRSLKSLISHRFGFGGSGITKDLRDWIWQNISKGETVVELGAGLVSTRILRKRFTLFSVEDDLNFIGLYANVTYIHAEIDSTTNWYSLKPEQLPENFNLLIIDGPSGSHLRKNILDSDWIFERTQTIIVDDTWRESERLLAKSIGIKINASVYEHSSFSVVSKIKD